MGDELRGENLVHLNVRFSTETELKKIQDFLYEKSGQGVSFTGLVEAMVNEVTIVTAVHNIKSNKGSRTAGVDKIKMDKYLQMPKDELILLIQSSFRNYRPKPARREYIEKSNGKKRPLGIPTVLDRIIQECVRIIIEPICEARFYPQSYGFRPYRAQKHAIRGIINVINAGCKSPDQPVWAIEGDIKGCFDNINHRLLLQKLWRIGIHDKRVLKIISQMLKAGYMENDLFHATELGTPQGGILSPLLSNVYLNDFDWYVGRMYMEPHRQCKHKGNDTRRLKWAGVTPKYNYRYADDWVILTSTEKEALRLKRVLTKYFRNRMKLELSQEKTYVTDLRTNGIHFLGFVVKAERKRKTPDPATWTKHLVGKPLPDMERLGKKIKKLLEEVHRIELCQKVNVQAAQIQYVNSVIMQKIEVVVRITKDHCPPQEQTIFEWFDLMRNPTDALSRPDLEINLEHHRVFKHGTEVYMSRYEYGVLSLMAQHPGKLFTKEQIFEAVWHKDSESYLRAVTSTIGRIRQKIEDDKDHPRYIKTVSNIGYQFVPSSELVRLNRNL